MNLTSKPTDSRSWQAGRWPLSLAAPAFASSALWLFMTVWLPAVEGLPSQDAAPQVSPPIDLPAHAVPTWPAPAVRDEGAASAEPSPTF